MSRKYVESTLPWRGSLTDLVTDIAYLLTPEEGEDLIRELRRYLTMPNLADKWQGKGHTGTSPKKAVLTPPKNVIRLVPPKQPTIDLDSFVDYLEDRAETKEYDAYVKVCQKLAIDQTADLSWQEIQKSLESLVAVYTELSERLARDLLTLKKNISGGEHATDDQTPTPAKDRRSVGHAGKPNVSEPSAGGGGEVFKFEVGQEIGVYELHPKRLLYLAKIKSRLNTLIGHYYGLEGYPFMYAEAFLDTPEENWTSLIVKRLLTSMGRSPEQVKEGNSLLTVLVLRTLKEKADQGSMAKAEFLVDLEPGITRALSHEDIAKAFAGSP